MLEPNFRLDDRYIIIARLGQGGMSYVYRARDEKLKREVAIKVLKEELIRDEEMARRFNQEARAAAGLSHPNVVTTYDIVDSGSMHYIVMELVEGITLKNYIAKKGILSDKETIGIAIQAASGLSEAHRQDIVHRDVKPQNIIISKDGKVKVSDFGIAQLSEEDDSDEDMVVGSAHYISPEQVSEGTADKRSDIYSLGITMYEMATGRVPYSGDNAVDIALMHVENALIPPKVFNPELSPALNDIIIKTCSKDPDMRYQSADELIEDLRKAAAELELDGTGELKEDAGHASSGADKYTIKRLIPAAALILIALILIVFSLSMYLRSLRRRQDIANSPPESSAASDTSETEMNYTINIEGEDQVPDVTGLSVNLARARLSEFGLSMDSSSEEYSDIYREGTVIKQNPSGGELFSVGTTVFVTVSGGSVLDHLSDDTPETAEDKLTGAGFRVSQSYDETFSDEVSEGRVIGCRLIDSDGETVYRESDELPDENVALISPDNYTLYTAKLILSLGSVSDYVLVPELIGKTADEAREELTSLGLILGSVSAAHSEDAPYGTVVAMSIASGEYLKPGSSVDLAVSVSDDQDVAEGEDVSKLTEKQPSAGAELSDEYYYANIDTTTVISGGNLVGGNSAVNVSVRLRQFVDGADEYTHIFGPIPVTLGDEIPVSFRNIRGVYGVDEGFIEVYNPETAEIYSTYRIEFNPL